MKRKRKKKSLWPLALAGVGVGVVLLTIRELRRDNPLVTKDPPPPMFSLGW